MIAGPTSSGKTVFVRRVLESLDILLTNLIKPKIIWCHGQWQDSYSQKIPGVHIDYYEGLPSEEYIKENKYNMIIIDDLMTELGGDPKLANLFTKVSHHLSISVVFIVQNIFHQAKCMRNVSLNCHYLILMKNPRDRSQIYCLARQLYPSNPKFLLEAFEDATKEPYSYLKIDLTPTTPEEYRLQSRITPTEFKDTGICVYTRQ